MLSRLGVGADVAVDGQEAVDAVRGNEFDLILMDVHMPRRRRRRGHRRDPPVGPSAGGRHRGCTANALEGDRERLIAAGMDGYLSKPVTAAALESLLLRSPTGKSCPARVRRRRSGVVARITEESGAADQLK